MECVKIAQAQGLDLHHQNVRGETALHGAASRGADSIVQYFVVEHGARPDEKTKTGLTVLDYALGKNITIQLPVPHDSTVALVRRLGGH